MRRKSIWIKFHCNLAKTFDSLKNQKVLARIWIFQCSFLFKFQAYRNTECQISFTHCCHRSILKISQQLTFGLEATGKILFCSFCCHKPQYHYMPKTICRSRSDKRNDWEEGNSHGAARATKPKKGTEKTLWTVTIMFNETVPLLIK